MKIEDLAKEELVSIKKLAQDILDLIVSKGVTTLDGINAMHYLIAACCITKEQVVEESEVLKSLQHIAGYYHKPLPLESVN